MSQNENKKQEEKAEESQEEASVEEALEEMEGEKNDTKNEEDSKEEEKAEELPEPDPEIEEVTEKEEKKLLKTEETKLAEFRSGDTVRIYYKIIEGDKHRIQPFEGIVIAQKGKGISRTFTVRRIGADGIGVERIFPLNSPNITKLEVKKMGKVRRSKLYYLRQKKGRAAVRVKTKTLKLDAKVKKPKVKTNVTE